MSEPFESAEEKKRAEYLEELWVNALRETFSGERTSSGGVKNTIQSNFTYEGGCYDCGAELKSHCSCSRDSPSFTLEDYDCGMENVECVCSEFQGEEEMDEREVPAADQDMCDCSREGFEYCICIRGENEQCLDPTTCSRLNQPEFGRTSEVHRRTGVSIVGRKPMEDTFTTQVLRQTLVEVYDFFRKRLSASNQNGRNLKLTLVEKPRKIGKDSGKFFKNPTKFSRFFKILGKSLRFHELDAIFQESRESLKKILKKK